MGNACVRPNLGSSFMQSVTAAIWKTRPPEDRLPPPSDQQKNDTSAKPSDTHDAPPPPQPKSSSPVHNNPPAHVKITADDEPPKPPSANNKANNDVAEAEKTKKAAHMKRVSSVGVSIDSVLGRKTSNIKDLYSLGKKLGQGQFGTTFLCVEKETHKEFACKSIAKRKLTTQEDVEDVRREIQIMHHLAGHPNVIQIVGAYEDAVAVHVLMELCAGGELFDRIIQRGHYTERKAAQLARVIVGVVEACHSLGVMHRDLKPENFLFVDEEEEAPLKTIDFGLSVFFKPGMLQLTF